MPNLASVTPTQLGLITGLSLFFGFAFEGFYADDLPSRPGGVRTFPLLALAGAVLYALDPPAPFPFVAGLLVVGSWLFSYVHANLRIVEHRVESHFIIPTAIVFSYAMGPMVLTQPLWFSVAATVLVVLLIGSRKRLHALVERVPRDEIFTAGKFLLLVGVVLPLLYGAPRIPSTDITPFKVWLAVVAVSTISYASYLLQRYVFPRQGLMVTAVLGGLYSSTATTVVLSRMARLQGVTAEITAAIVATTAMMYLRVVAVCAVFNMSLAAALALPLGVLATVAFALAYLFVRRSGPSPAQTASVESPLEVSTALIFAILLVVTSLATRWVQTHLGATGIVALGAVVGVTDIDPFVISVAQSGTVTAGVVASAMAIVVATASNNLLKAMYAVAFSRRSESWVPASVLAGMSLAGLAVGFLALR